MSGDSVDGQVAVHVLSVPYGEISLKPGAHADTARSFSGESAAVLRANLAVDVILLIWQMH